MSLHDMYFSSKNKNHMFNVIRELVLKETNEDINNNTEYIDLYRFKYSLIFDRSNSDNLVDLNKFLVDEIAPIYINDIQSKYTSKNITIKPKESNESKESKESKKDNIKQKTQLYINSSERLENSLNRYEYYINLPENKKFSLKQITIPVENNILFSNPVICVQLEIKNEKYDIYCQFKNEILIQNKKYNIYESFQELEINTDRIIKVSILTNLRLKVIENQDKIKIKIKNIKHKEKDYLCLKINENHDIINGDNIGIYKNNNLISSLIIDNKIENNLIIKDKKLDFDNSSEYYILNMNLQNNLLIFYI